MGRGVRRVPRGPNSGQSCVSNKGLQGVNKENQGQVWEPLQKTHILTSGGSLFQGCFVGLGLVSTPWKRREGPGKKSVKG